MQLITCTAGEGHGFNQVTRHFSQESCRFSHKYKHQPTHAHTATHTHQHTHINLLVVSVNQGAAEWKQGPKSNVKCPYGWNFFHLDDVLSCIQTVFLGKSFIIREPSPLVQTPRDPKEHRKKGYVCCRGVYVEEIKRRKKKGKGVIILRGFQLFPPSCRVLRYRGACVLCW